MLGAAGFLVPYLAVFENSLILQDTVLAIIVDTLIALCGTVMLAAAMMGNFFYNINWFYRFVLFAGGLATLVPGYLSSGIGIASAIMVFILVREAQKGLISLQASRRALYETGFYRSWTNGQILCIKSVEEPRGTSC